MKTQSQSSLPTIFLTGANGFVGRFFCEEAKDRPFLLKSLHRPPKERSQSKILLPHSPHSAREQIVYGDLLEESPSLDWNTLLSGVDAVVHLAARAHVMTEHAQNPLEEYRRINTQGTLTLAKRAAAAGVKKFIYVSSIKVNGEETPDISKPFTEKSPEKPEDPYGLSKLEAEKGLVELAGDLNSNMQVIIIRPPLIYGPGVKGNFLRLVHLIQKGIPLPLKSVHNKRSLLYVGNLVDFLFTCLTKLPAENSTEVFLLADAWAPSTPELLEEMAKHMQKKFRLLPFPVGVMKTVGFLLGQKGTLDRLCNSLVIDPSHAYQRLNWQPPYSFSAGMEATLKASGKVNS